MLSSFIVAGLMMLSAIGLAEGPKVGDHVMFDFSRANLLPEDTYLENMRFKSVVGMGIVTRVLNDGTAEIKFLGARSFKPMEEARPSIMTLRSTLSEGPVVQKELPPVVEVNRDLLDVVPEDRITAARIDHFENSSRFVTGKTRLGGKFPGLVYRGTLYQGTIFNGLFLAYDRNDFVRELTPAEVESKYGKKIRIIEKSGALPDTDEGQVRLFSPERFYENGFVRVVVQTREKSKHQHIDPVNEERYLLGPEDFYIAEGVSPYGNWVAIDGSTKTNPRFVYKGEDGIPIGVFLRSGLLDVIRNSGQYVLSPVKEDRAARSFKGSVTNYFCHAALRALSDSNVVTIHIR